MKVWLASAQIVLLLNCAGHVHLPSALPVTAGREAKEIFSKRYAPTGIRTGALGRTSLVLASGHRIESPEDLLPLLPAASTTRTLVLMSEEAKAQSNVAASFIAIGLGIVAASFGAGFVYGLNVGNYDYLWATVVAAGVGAFISLTSFFTSNGLQVRSDALKDAAFASYQNDYRAKPLKTLTLSDLPGSQVTKTPESQ